MAAVAALSFEEFNDYVKRQFSDENQVLVAYAPEGAPGLPTVGELETALAQVRGAELEGTSPETVVAPLLPEGTRLKGARVKRTAEGAFGSTVWTLRNGVRVVVKPTDFMTDQVCLYARVPGGRSLLSDEEMLAAQVLDYYIGQTGVAESDAALLRKQLAGKTVRCWPGTGAYENGFSGTSSPKDVETLLQLVYLYLAQPGSTGRRSGWLWNSCGTPIGIGPPTRRSVTDRRSIRRCTAVRRAGPISCTTTSTASRWSSCRRFMENSTAIRVISPFHYG